MLWWKQSRLRVKMKLNIPPESRDRRGNAHEAGKRNGNDAPAFGWICAPRVHPGGILGAAGPGAVGCAGGRRAGRTRAEHRAKGAQPRAKSVILVFLTGGLSHLDSFDMKPDAPDGIRGEFKPIATAVPGISMCEHLPRVCGPGRPAGDRAVAGARVYQPPERDPRDPDRPLAAGCVFRQDRLARRLSVLCRGDRRDPPAQPTAFPAG